MTGQFSLSPGGVCFLIPLNHARPRRATFAHNGTEDDHIVEIMRTNSVTCNFTVNGQMYVPPPTSPMRAGGTGEGVERQGSGGIIPNFGTVNSRNVDRRPSALELMFQPPTEGEVPRAAETSPSGHFKTSDHRGLVYKSQGPSRFTSEKL